MFLIDENIKKLILNKADELGFVKAGFAKAGILEEESDYLRSWINKGFDANMKWIEKGSDKRKDVKLIMEDAKTVISLAYNYYTPFAHDEKSPKISRYAWGEDYHKVLKNKLKILCKFVENSIYYEERSRVYPDSVGEPIPKTNPKNREIALSRMPSGLAIKCISYVDDGPVMDKVWAKKAGIGWQGKHTNIINPEYGSWIFLCEIITNLECNAFDKPVEDLCNSCRICINACPTGAIIDDYQLDSNLCISYQTIENKGDIPDYINLFGWVFGCDVCQDVCPFNKGDKPTKDTSFFPKSEVFNKSKEELEQINEQQFKEVLPIPLSKEQNIQDGKGICRDTFPLDPEGTPWECKIQNLNYQASYIRLLNNGELSKRAKSARDILKSCNCCPHDCKVDRINGELGICVSGHPPIVSSYTPHFGEEPVLSGTRGAGNIFFGNCNLKCVYCQNFEISQSYHTEKSKTVSLERLADIMIELQEMGCHNIGLVSPTHFSAQILQSIYIASKKGLNLPIIYNTNGYDSVDTLKLYDGVIDIYLPDLKYGNNDFAKAYSKIDNYFERSKIAIKEMFRQVGDELMYEAPSSNSLKNRLTPAFKPGHYNHETTSKDILENNLAPAFKPGDEDPSPQLGFSPEEVVVRGLIIRHLVLPNDLSESEKVFEFISEELSPNVHISLMSQYNPMHKAKKDILINRKIRESEYGRILDLMDKYGLKNGWFQEMDSHQNYLPEFNKDRVNPFNN